MTEQRQVFAALVRFADKDYPPTPSLKMAIPATFDPNHGIIEPWTRR